VNATLVVVNPTAGGGRAGALWERLAPLARSLAAVQVTVPQSRAELAQAVGRGAVEGFRRIVVVGGDGSIHVAANALLETGTSDEVVLGVVPAGTGSDLARVLGLPRHPEEALRRALLGPAKSLDAGRCEGEASEFFFANIASAGIGGLVDQAVNAIPDRGRTAFLAAALGAFRAYRCASVRVDVDGERWFEGRILVLAVANGTTFGKGMRIAPRARPDDGLFDVVLVKEISAVQLVLHLPQLYMGRHMRARPVRSVRAREVRIEPLEKMPPFDVDGETYQSGAATFTVQPGRLRFAVARTGDEP
jgi:diacylglycerol kinase (ATP)